MLQDNFWRGKIKKLILAVKSGVNSSNHFLLCSRHLSQDPPVPLVTLKDVISAFALPICKLQIITLPSSGVIMCCFFSFFLGKN